MNILFAGVGGQGVILAGKVLMEAALNAGFDVKSSEIHGMAQRGGSVECQIRYGDRVYSPLVDKGTADFVVSFEYLEVLRKLDYPAPGGKLIVNTQRIDPVPVAIGTMEYPADLDAWLSRNAGASFVKVDAETALAQLGSRKALNTLMLGVLSRYLEFGIPDWEKAIKSCVKASFVEMNIKAFKAGREMRL